MSAAFLEHDLKSEKTSEIVALTSTYLKEDSVRAAALIHKECELSEARRMNMPMKGDGVEVNAKQSQEGCCSPAPRKLKE